MLLRALEEKTFLPFGSDREVRSDFQLIAGTNRDLLVAVRKGRFPEGLLARINLWPFTLPRLRSRPEDIEPNIESSLTSMQSGPAAASRLVKRQRNSFTITPFQVKLFGWAISEI